MGIKLTIYILNLLFALVKIIGTRANECGTVKFLEAKINSGKQISKGEWPFLAALYYIDESKFFCGGTIISAGHVLTAAHCVQQKSSNVKLAPEQVAYNLDVKIETSLQQRYVAEIHVHSGWKVFSEKYDADIAIFVLKELVIFTNYIQPVCIPEDGDAFPDVKGSIVGWGLTEYPKTPHRHESIPRHAFTTALNDSYCYTTNHFFAMISSSRTFCGGGQGGSPNNLTLAEDFFGAVLPDSFTIYTNVKPFREWIRSVIRVDKIQSKCNFEFTTFYTCTVLVSNITVPDLVADTFRGTHLAGHSDETVTQISFWQGKVEYIPDGIGLQFRYLEKFLVGYDDRNLGLKQIKRSNFKNMPILTLLQLDHNYIETVDVDTLWDLPNLEYFELMNGQLGAIPEKFFEKNTKLLQVNGNGNNIEYLPIELFKHNPLIKKVYFKGNKLRSISTEFLTLKAIQKIDLHGNSCLDMALSDVPNLKNFQDLIWYNC